MLSTSYYDITSCCQKYKEPETPIHKNKNRFDVMKYDYTSLLSKKIYIYFILNVNSINH